MSLNETKTFALEVLDVIDELVKPEIKYSFIEKFWHFFTSYAKNKIIKKPDSEIIEKLLIIRKKLNSKFSDLDKSVQINVAESMGSVKIPNVGELAKIKNLTTINREQAKQLEKELVEDYVRVMMVLKYGMKEKKLIKKLIVILVVTRQSI